MTPEQFCYWLQGFFEIGHGASITGLNQEQSKIIRDHLKLVFSKVTPEYHSLTVPFVPEPKCSPLPSLKSDLYCTSLQADALRTFDFRGMSHFSDGVLPVRACGSSGTRLTSTVDKDGNIKFNDSDINNILLETIDKARVND